MIGGSGTAFAALGAASGRELLPDRHVDQVGRSGMIPIGVIGGMISSSGTISMPITR